MLSLFYARYRLYRPQLSPCIIFYVFIMVQFSGLIVVLLDSPPSLILLILHLFPLIPVLYSVTPECFLEHSLILFLSLYLSLLSSLRYPSFLARCLLSPVIDFRPFAISPSGFWTFFPPAIAPPISLCYIELELDIAPVYRLRFNGTGCLIPPMYCVLCNLSLLLTVP